MSTSTKQSNDNIVQLRAPKLSLPAFSYSVLDQAEKDIQENFNKVDHSIYPHWTGEGAPIERIVSNTDKARESVRSSVIAVEAKVNSTTTLSTLNGFIIQALEDLEDAETPEEIAELEAKIARYREQGDKDVKDITDTLSEWNKTLTGHEGDIMFYDFGSMMTDEFDEITIKIKHLEEVKATAKQNMEDAEEKRKTLADALEILLLEENIFQQLGELIPTLDEIQALMELNSQQAAIIVLALDLLSNLSSIIGDIFQEKMFSDAQDHYYGLVTLFTQEFDDAEEQLHQENIKQEAIELLIGIDELRGGFCTEMTNLSTAYSAVASAMESSLELDRDYTQILSDAEAMTDYMQAIISDIN